MNVAQRYYADGKRDILAALRTSGGAVVLCSLTTMLGYVALLGSHNQAVRGMGMIAVVGEVSCLLAAVTVLPALWLLIERRRGGRAFRQSRCQCLPSVGRHAPWRSPRNGIPPPPPV